MLLREGDARDDVVDRWLAAMLAAAAGALNAIAFSVFGFFSANMTGNVSALSIGVATGRISTAVFYFGIILAFVLGAALCTLVLAYGGQRGLRGIYALCLAAEGTGIVLLGLWARAWLPGHVASAVTVVALAFLLGFQNAIVTRISDARIRTTHVSGMLTDIGIGVALLATSRAQWVHKSDSARTRLALHLGTVGAFLAGGVVGLLGYQVVGAYFISVCGLLLVAIAGPYVLRAGAVSN